VLMFAPWQIALAAFLGTPLAGAALFAYNDYRARMPWRALAGLLAGLAVVVVMSAGVLPRSRELDLLLWLSTPVALWRLSLSKQGDRFHAHVAAGGRAFGVGRVVAVSVAVLLGVVAVGVYRIMARANAATRESR